jgi:hypothetical protein
VVTRARFTADLISTINANTSSLANAVFISSGGDVTIANSITVGGNIPGFVQNSYLQATFTQNTAVSNLFADTIQVANAATTYVTKSVHLTSNNALINLINDRLQIANADATYVTKSVALSSNTALIGLINDRLQVANLTSELSTYWPSANAIAYIDANAGGFDMTVNTSIFIASGGETSIEVPITSNNNLVQVYLNGFALTRSIDWTANSTHIKNIEALASGDIIQVHEYKMHPANTLNRSAGGGGGPSFQGSVSGYSSGGACTPTVCNVIDKFPFSSDANATDVGDLTQARGFVAGQSSSTNGYSSGGSTPSEVNTIDKFPFSSDANATDVGNLTESRNYSAGQSSSTNGYTSGGAYVSSPTLTTRYNIIDKFPFSSDANATDVGDLTVDRAGAGGQSSSTHGYTSGGFQRFPETNVNTIDKFPFSADANATDVGDSIIAMTERSGQSSSTHGYISGGGVYINPSSVAVCNIIDKFPFSSDANATDVGDLTVGRRNTAGQSSTTNGYTSGGHTSPFTICNIIDKFPFSSDANATDVGDLTVARPGAAGQQV